MIPCVERSGAAIKLEIIRLVEQAPPGKRKKDIAAKLSVPESTLSTVLKEKLSLSFNEDINLVSQKERILHKIDSINKQIIDLDNKLKNKAYVTKAPKEIVQNDKNLLKELTIEDKKLRSIVSSIN